MANEWEIKSRGHRCSATDRQFADGETFYTLLFREQEGFSREDLCKEAWKERDRSRTPFSSWKSKYEIPPPPPPEALGKQTAEVLLRRYMNEPGPQFTNARYILALMLERKRTLKPIETKVDENGQILLIYEHRESGEVFVVPDPQLKLDQIASVQEEVADLLTAPPAPAEEVEPEESAESPEASPDPEAISEAPLESEKVSSDADDSAQAAPSPLPEEAPAVEVEGGV